MNKHLFYGLLILALNFFALSSFSVKNTFNTEEEEILLQAERSRPTKSLSPIPDIKAYVEKSCVKLAFNEVVIGNVSIVITKDADEVIYSENLPVNSPMVWPIFIDFDENSSYLLEIFVNDWHFYGKF